MTRTPEEIAAEIAKEQMMIGRDASELAEIIAAAIREAVEAERERSRPQWIDVRDEKPNTREPALYRRDRPDGKISVGIAYWTVSQRWNPEMNSERWPHGFTHWAPLPEPDAIRARSDPAREDG